MQVLGIETSCDESGVALYDSEQGLLGHQLYSQIEVHAKYGGVVPELASRDHIQRLLPLVGTLLNEVGVSPEEINGVAYTAGPGLVGALLVGSGVGRSLAMGWGVPAVAVHHMEGHLLAPMLESSPPPFPFVALLVSGGHTMLVDVEGIGRYRLLGESLDDAAGEAFDKTAKMLGLGYPGGPVLAEKAALGDSARFRFPRPMCDRPGLDFSFSGLKTFALNTWKQADCHDEQLVADICRAFEEAVVDTLFKKCSRALKYTGRSRLVIAGGVSANKSLRATFQALAGQDGFQVYYPRVEFCTDNGAMIAYAGCMRLAAGQQESLAFNARARWPLGEMPPIEN